MALSAGQSDLKTRGHMTITAKCDIHMELHTTEMKKWERSGHKGLVFCAVELGFFLFPEEPLQISGDW